MGLLRLWLAFSVVLMHSHSFYGFTGIGGYAVPAFFVMSGFYMNLILTTKYRGTRQVWLFYSNRALRLYPMYWAVLIVFVAAAQIHDPHWPLIQISAIAANPLALATDGSKISLWAAIPNLTFVGADFFRLFIVDVHGDTLHLWVKHLNEGPDWRGAYQYLIDPPIWSLGVEILFYVAVPGLFILSTRWLAVACAASILLQYFIGAFLTPMLGSIYLTMPFNLCFFLLGMLAFRGADLAYRVNGKLRYAFIWVAFGICVTGGYLQGSFIGQLPFLMTVFAACLPFIFAWSRHSTLDKKLAAYSYPIYLCHFLFAYSMTPLGNWAGPPTFALSAGLSFLLIKWIDNPIEAMRQRRLNAQPSHSISANVAAAQ